MKPLLYTSGCSWIFVLTTSTGTQPAVRDRAADAAASARTKVLHVEGPLARDLVGRHGPDDACVNRCLSTAA